jgi:metal-dependent amidase/aminoacylase/carboxypeptidase family protein
MHGTEASVRYVCGYPPVVNDEREAERFFRVASVLMGPEAVRRCDRIMAGEDFSYYLREKPGCFFFVGAGREDGTSAPHHHPRFDIDERAMLNAARLLVGVADDAAAEAAGED